MQDGEVEDNERQLEGKAEANLQEHHDVEEVLGFWNDICDGTALGYHPSNGRLLDHQIAKTHAQKEE